MLLVHILGSDGILGGEFSGEASSDQKELG
jgi:hypothetical protein